jgi:hypothetical protein
VLTSTVYSDVITSIRSLGPFVSRRGKDGNTHEEIGGRCHCVDKLPMKMRSRLLLETWFSAGRVRKRKPSDRIVWTALYAAEMSFYDFEVLAEVVIQSKYINATVFENGGREETFKQVLRLRHGIDLPSRYARLSLLPK